MFHGRIAQVERVLGAPDDDSLNQADKHEAGNGLGFAHRRVVDMI